MTDAIHRLPPVSRPAAPAPAQGVRPSADTPKAHAFDELLGHEIGNAQLGFSAHAQSRLASRRIQLTTDQVERLQAGVQQAAQKGARDSLVMLDDLAFIVSVKNRTVVTAFDGAGKSGNVFTQIDSAVIV